MKDSTISIDWGSDIMCEVNTTCPYCNGEQYIDFELWKEKVIGRKGKEEFADERKQLDADYKEYRAECRIDNTDPLTFEEWLEEVFWEEMTQEDMHSEHQESARCHECEEGFVYPMMNYAYPVNCDFTEENRRIALDCGLFLFEMPDSGDVYMSLMGGGMDLSPNILLAYLRLKGCIPLDWAMEFRQDYRANITEEQHQEIAAACRETVRNQLYHIQNKLASLNLFIDNPEECKRKLEERSRAFDDRLEALSSVDEPLIRGLGAVAAFAQAVGDVV